MPASRARKKQKSKKSKNVSNLHLWRGGVCGKNAILLDIDEYCHDAKAEHVVNCCDAYPEVEYCYDAEAPVVCYGAEDVVEHCCIFMHFTAFLCISLRFSAFLCISMHFSSFLLISLHFSAFHCINLHTFIFHTP